MITIDIRWLHTSGIGTYLKNILPLVIGELYYKKICLLGNVEEMQKFNWSIDKNVYLIEAQSSMYSISEQFEIANIIPKETQLYFATHYNIPLLYKGKTMVTVYDLFHVAMPNLVRGIHKRIYANFMFNLVRKKADAIITISQFTKDELIRFTGKGSQELYPIHLGVEESWFNIDPGNNPYGKPYLLYVGNVKPHKNLSRLIRAFGMLVDKIPHDLVIIGKKDGFITGDKSVVHEAAKLGNRVQFTGYVEDKLLRQYFAHAEVFVFPSLYEGFGLPPLEAMAAGCPVLVSNAASLPEVCEDAAIYCDPYNHEDIAKKILLLMKDSSLRETLRRKGVEHARKFTWEKCASETCSVINRLLL